MLIALLSAQLSPVTTEAAGGPALDFRASLLAGYSGATAVATESRQTGRHESAGTQLSVEYSWDSRRTFGLEHTRATWWKDFRRGMSVTAATFRWYFSRPHPVAESSAADTADRTVIVEQNGFSPYLGAALGFASGFVLSVDTATGAAVEISERGLYTGVKLGFEIPAFSTLSVRTEAAWGTTWTGGAVAGFFLGLGGVWYF